jgi:ankyrin repeat protein
MQAGTTPIHYAAQHKYEELLRMMIERGADVHAVDLVSQSENICVF